MAACRLSLSQKLHHFMSHSQLCVSKVCNLRFPKNSKRIPKEFSKNSQKSQIRTLQPYIPKKYPKNSQKIPKEFPKNSKTVPHKFPKISDSRLWVEILFELVYNQFVPSNHQFIFTKRQKRRCPLFWYS